jgi:hypothetical protein
VAGHLLPCQDRAGLLRAGRQAAGGGVAGAEPGSQDRQQAPLTTTNETADTAALPARSHPRITDTHTREPRHRLCISSNPTFMTLAAGRAASGGLSGAGPGDGGGCCCGHRDCRARMDERWQRRRRTPERHRGGLRKISHQGSASGIFKMYQRHEPAPAAETGSATARSRRSPTRPTRPTRPIRQTTWLGTCCRANDSRGRIMTFAQSTGGAADSAGPPTALDRGRCWRDGTGCKDGRAARDLTSSR